MPPFGDGLSKNCLCFALSPSSQRLLGWTCDADASGMLRVDRRRTRDDGESGRHDREERGRDGAAEVRVGFDMAMFLRMCRVDASERSFRSLACALDSVNWGAKRTSLDTTIISVQI